MSALHSEYGLSQTVQDFVVYAEVFYFSLLTSEIIMMKIYVMLDQNMLKALLSISCNSLISRFSYTSLKYFATHLINPLNIYSCSICSIFVDSVWVRFTDTVYLCKTC